LEKRNENLADAVQIQANSIKTLKDSAEVTDTITSDIKEKTLARQKQYNALRAKLKELENSVEDIKKFGSVSVPPDVSVLLNDARTRTTGVTNAAGVTVKESYQLRKSTP
jgi:hypothetical protein